MALSTLRSHHFSFVPYPSFPFVVMLCLCEAQGTVTGPVLSIVSTEIRCDQENPHLELQEELGACHIEGAL